MRALLQRSGADSRAWGTSPFWAAGSGRSEFKRVPTTAARPGGFSAESGHPTPLQENPYTPRADIAVSLMRGADASYIAKQEDGTLWTFDGLGRLTQVEQTDGSRFLVRQGLYGVESVTMPGSQAKLLFDYEPNSRRLVLVSELPDSSLGGTPPHSFRYGYDGAGRLTDVTDREGQTTHFHYDGDTQRLASITDALGHVAVSLRYDESGRVAAHADARGMLTGRWNTMRYTTNPDGSRVTVEEKVPSGFAPDWPPILTDVYDAQVQLVRHETRAAPDETPELITWAQPRAPDVGGVRSGGATAVLTGDPAPRLPVPAGACGRADRPSRRSRRPLPAPFCGLAPAVPKIPRDVNTGGGLPEAVDPRLPVLARLALALRGATNAKLDPYGNLAGFEAADTSRRLGRVDG